MDSAMIGDKGDVLISLLTGVGAIYFGARMRSTDPHRMLTLGRPWPVYRVLVIAGSLILLTAIVRLAAQ